MEEVSGAAAIGDRVKAALESADLTAIADLLDPNVRWGAPGDDAPSCQNRSQVLAWYQRGREAGVRARVTEVTVYGDKVLVGLKMSGDQAAEGAGGEADRWQGLTVGGEAILAIRGF